jgi:hypothetical protein
MSEHQCHTLLHRSYDADADGELRGRSRWGDPMAGRVKKRGDDAFDLPAPVINDANRAALEASGANTPNDYYTGTYLSSYLLSL